MSDEEKSSLKCSSCGAEIVFSLEELFEKSPDADALRLSKLISVLIISDLRSGSNGCSCNVSPVLKLSKKCINFLAARQLEELENLRKKNVAWFVGGEHDYIEKLKERLKNGLVLSPKAINSLRRIVARIEERKMPKIFGHYGAKQGRDGFPR